MRALEQFLANPIVAQFLGLAVGLFTSFFSWWVLFRWLTPCIALSPSVSKTIEKSSITYKFQFANVGRRTVIDLQVRALIRIKGLIDPASSVWQVAHLVMREDGDRVYSYPNVDPMRRSGIRWTLPLLINKVESFKRSPYPAHIRAKAEQESLLLEEVLSLGTAAEIRVIVSGYDEFSGARKIYEKTYLPRDVKSGKFVKGEVIEEPAVEVPSPLIDPPA